MKRKWQILLDQLKSVQANRRLLILKELELCAEPDSIPELLEISKRDSDPQVRTMAAELCRKIAETLEHPRDPYGQFRI